MNDILTTTFYIASCIRHAPKWRELHRQGHNILCSWIHKESIVKDEDLPDLVDICIKEAAAADVTILYSEPDDILKCALVEAGACLGAGKILIVIGSGTSLNSSMLAHPRCVNFYHTLENGIDFIRSLA